jgi:hypothetical protein
VVCFWRGRVRLCCSRAAGSLQRGVLPMLLPPDRWAAERAHRCGPLSCPAESPDWILLPGPLVLVCFGTHAVTQRSVPDVTEPVGGWLAGGVGWLVGECRWLVVLTGSSPGGGGGHPWLFGCKPADCRSYLGAAAEWSLFSAGERLPLLFIEPACFGGRQRCCCMQVQAWRWLGLGLANGLLSLGELRLFGGAASVPAAAAAAVAGVVLGCAGKVPQSG